MDLSDIKEGQRWRLINILNRPDVIIQSVNKYSEIIYWNYNGENVINESEYCYFIKNFKLI